MKSMLKVMAVLGFIIGIASFGHAGTPQETYFQGQFPLSGTTIFASSASVSSVNAATTLTVSTPTAVNSGGATFQGRNCFTKIVIQMSTSTVFTIADNLTTKMTINGIGLGTSGVNTLTLSEDHLGPLCTAIGDQTVFTLTNTGGLSTNPEAIDVEGYTTYGGAINAGAMQ